MHLNKTRSYKLLYLVIILIIFSFSTMKIIDLYKISIYRYYLSKRCILNVTENTGSNGTSSKTSGAVNVLPWENDDRYLDGMRNTGSTVLLAAFRTVLKDPLPGEEFNVHHAADLLAGTVVKPGEIFSQNRLLGPYIASKGYQWGPTYAGSELIKTIGGGVCKIASTLYNVAILSNLDIIERHPHGMPVPYVPYGQDATVSYGSKDFRFINNTPYPVLIWAKGIGNELYIAFYGRLVPEKIEWQHETLKVYKASSRYKKNKDLPLGEERVILEGMDGVSVRSWLNITKYDGTVVIRQLGISNYNPMPHLIERG